LCKLLKIMYTSKGYDFQLASSVSDKGVPRIFHWRAKIEGPKAESWKRFLGRVQQPPPPARESGGTVSSPAGFRAEPRPPKGYPLFSALRMASPDTIILLLWTIMQPLGARPPWPPCVLPLVGEILRIFSRVVKVHYGNIVFGNLYFITAADRFKQRDVVSAVYATATWLGGWLGGCLSVYHMPVLYQNG